MENKGLNVFNSKYVLADQASATDTDFLISNPLLVTSISITGPATGSLAATGFS